MADTDKCKSIYNAMWMNRQDIVNTVVHHEFMDFGLGAPLTGILQYYTVYKVRPVDGAVVSSQAIYIYTRGVGGSDWIWVELAGLLPVLGGNFSIAHTRGEYK